MDEDERQRIAALRSKLTDRKELTLAERFRVLFALRNYDAARFPEAVDALLTGFADPSALLRHEIAFVLGQMQAERAVPTLIQVLDDESENSMVRHEAGEALGAIASEECGPALQKHLNDRLPEVYETCHLALERFKKLKLAKQTQAETGLDSCYKSVDPAPPIQVDESGKVLTTDQLTEMMLAESQDLVKRYGAMFTLRNKGSNGEPSAVAALCSGFQTESALMRHELAYILGQLQDSSAVDTLIERLRDPREHPMVRHEAAEALGSIGYQGTNALLTEFLKDPEPIVADSCEVALDIWEYENSGNLDYVDSTTDPDPGPGPAARPKLAMDDAEDISRLLHALRHLKILDSDAVPDLDELVTKSRCSPAFRLALRDSPDVLKELESVLDLARHRESRHRCKALPSALKILRNIGAAERSPSHSPSHSPSPDVLASELSLFDQLCRVLGEQQQQPSLDAAELPIVTLLVQSLANWIKTRTKPIDLDAPAVRIHSHLLWIVRSLPRDAVSRFSILDACCMILAAQGVWHSRESLSLFRELVLNVQDVRLDTAALSSIQVWIGMMAESAFWAGRLNDLDDCLSESGLEYVLSALSGALEHCARSRTRRIPSGARDSLQYLMHIAHRVYDASREAQSAAEIQSTPRFVLLPVALKCLGAACAAPEADSAQDDPAQADMIAVLQELDVVGLVKGPLLRLSGGVTSREQLFTDRLSPSRELYEGESCDVLALIGNACHRRPRICDDLVQRDGLLSVMGLCGKMDDSVSPFTKEWALWAMRNILECSAMARKYVSEMDTMGVVVPDFLAKLQK